MWSYIGICGKDMFGQIRGGNGFQCKPPVSSGWIESGSSSRDLIQIHVYGTHLRMKMPPKRSEKWTRKLKSWMNYILVRAKTRLSDVHHFHAVYWLIEVLLVELDDLELHTFISGTHSIRIDHNNNKIDNIFCAKQMQYFSFSFRMAQSEAKL